MRSLAIIALVSLALGCSGPSPAVNGEPAQRTAVPQAADSPQEQTRFDEALMRLRIRRSLLAHLKTEALDVEVEVVGNTVVLSGDVEEHADRMVAEEVARSVSGVTEVNNEIAVEADAGESDGPITRGARATERELADATLELRVQTRLVRELGEIGFRIEVEASDGVVSLRGRIPDAQRKERAVESAEQVSGVEEVHDLLKVRE